MRWREFLQARSFRPTNTPFNSGAGYTSNSIGDPLPIGEDLLGRVVDGLGRPSPMAKATEKSDFAPNIQENIKPA
jgi:flagellum-specific ATP synthase